MMASYTVDDPGNATAGNPVTGPFTGPLTIEQTQTAFLPIDEDVEVEDVTNQLTTGGSPTKFHQLRVGVGDSLRIVHVFDGPMLLPTAAQRHPARLRFFKGETVFFTSDQQSATAEITNWSITFRKLSKSGR